MDAFDHLARTMRKEHLEQAAEALAHFARAADDREAWPHWRELERAWPLVEPPDRPALLVVARRLMRYAPDGARRLAVVEKLDR